MGNGIYQNNIIQSILHKRRKRRVEYLLSKVDVFHGMNILDMGCGKDGRSFERFIPEHCNITGIDLYHPSQVKITHPNFVYYKKDAEDLSSFRDNSYDLAISIGMMEHICDKNKLSRIAKELVRVSKQFIIVVPWRYAWIEPHFKFPFFQILPSKIQKILTISFDLHNLRYDVKKDSNYIRDHYQWLSSKLWKKIFNGTNVVIMPTLETIAVIGLHKKI